MAPLTRNSIGKRGRWVIHLKILVWRKHHGDKEEIAAKSRRALVDTPHRRYGHVPPLEYQASDTGLSLIITHHKRRCAEFVELRKAVALVDVGPKKEPDRLSVAPFLFEEPVISSRKTSGAHLPPMCRVDGVRAMCYSRLLVSAGDD